MIITAFFDESGTHNSSLRTVLAALLLSEKQVRAAQLYWDILLRCHNLTHLHAVDMFHQKKQFKKWHPADIIRMIDFAGYISTTNCQFGVLGVLYNSDYDMHYKVAGVPRRVRLDSKYGLCFRNTLSFACQIAAHANPSKLPDIHVVIEAGHANLNEALMIFEQMQKSGFEPFCSMLKSIKVGGKTDYMGLQMADMLAYSSARAEDSRTIEANDLQIGEFVDNIKRKGTVIRVPLTAGQIAEQREKLIEIFRLRRRSDK